MNSSDYLKIVLKFWEYTKGNDSKLLLEKLKTYYSGEIFLFENARSAEYVFLKSLHLNEGDEIIVQGFTCNAVVNPILWNKLKPVYVDINRKDLCINLEDLRRKITDRTKVIIVQHTFGMKADIEGLKEIVKHEKEKNNRNILVMEDCAHALGVKDLGGNFDTSIISFGIEKILSTRVGGALVVNNINLKKDFEIEYRKLENIGMMSTFIWLLNPLIWRVLRRFGNSQMKLAKFLNSVGILNMGFFKSELKGVRPSIYPRKLSNALCKVVYLSMQTLDENLEHRNEISNIYSSNIGVSQFIKISNRSYLRYPLLIDDVNVKEEIVNKLYEKNIFSGDWYNPIIYPKGTDFNSMMYEDGMCPIAQSVSTEILNLPTGMNIGKDTALEIAEVVNGCMKR